MPILPGHWAQPYGRGQETLEQRIFAQGRASFGGIRRSLPANCGHRPSPNRQAHMNDRERWIVGNTRNLSAMPLFFDGFHFGSPPEIPAGRYALASEKTRKVFHPVMIFARRKMVLRGRRQPVVHAPIVYDYVCPCTASARRAIAAAKSWSARTIVEFPVLRKPHRQTFPRRIGVMFCARKASPASVVSPLPFAGRTISFVSGGAQRI